LPFPSPFLSFFLSLLSFFSFVIFLPILSFPTLPHIIFNRSESADELYSLLFFWNSRGQSVLRESLKQRSCFCDLSYAFLPLCPFYLYALPYLKEKSPGRRRIL
jgi:hypothetical protein